MTEIKPVSEKQLKWLKKFNIPEDVIESLNSKSASDILKSKFEKTDTHVADEGKVTIDGTEVVHEDHTIQPSKYATMFISYVKDLVVSGKSVKEAIEIIKEAQKAF